MLLIWIFHGLTQRPSQFCQVSICQIVKCVSYFSSSNSSPFCVMQNERFRSRLKSDNPRDYELESFPTAAQV